MKRHVEVGLPYQRVFWGDELKRMLHLDQQQIGALTLLRAAYWINGGPLADDDRALANISRSQSLASWRRIRPVLARFFEVAGGLWRSASLDHELEEARRRAAEASRRGGKGAAARWGRGGDSGVEQASLLDAPAIEQASVEQSLRDSSSSSSSEDQREEKNHTFGVAALDPENSPSGAPPETLPEASETPRPLTASQREIQELEEWCRTLGAEPPSPGRLARLRQISGGAGELKRGVQLLHAEGNLSRGWDYAQKALASMAKRGALAAGAAAVNGHHPGPAAPSLQPFIEQARKLEEKAREEQRRLAAEHRAKLGM